MRLLQARPRARRLALALALLGVLPGAVLHPSAAHAAGSMTYTVTTTADPSNCPSTPGSESPLSLRCAIEQVNADGAADSAGNANDTITFQIADSGCSPVTINGAKTVCKISPATDLPALTANNVTIYGYSQSGASANTNSLHSSSGDNAVLTIQIDGSADTDPNGTVGLSIEGSHDTITGLSITGFNNGGLYLTTPGGASSGNTVAGDFIGVAPDGSNAYNGSDDVLVYGGSANNTIGGTGAGDRNVIESGNGNGSGTIGGVNIETDGNVIEGNYLGTAPNGTHVLGGAGLTVAFLSSGGGSNTLGGAGEAGNVINGAGGAVYAGGSKAIIEGNYIGTDAVGDAAITPEPGSTANFGSGIDVASGAAPNYVISDNLISGNLGYGIAVASPSSTVTGNKIGTNAAGTTAIPNDAGGIDVAASNVTIGGTGSGDGNLIDGGAVSSAGFADGVKVESQATNTTIEGNKIGVGLNGEKLGNAGNGIFFASNGTTTAYVQTVSSNTIAYNGTPGSGGNSPIGTGVQVGSQGYTSNIDVQITRNSIFENADHGIILFGQSPDACDSSSPSGQPLCPVIDSATTAVVSGHAPGCGAGCTIEVFVADTLPSDHGHGEGRTYLGSTTTDSSGNWTFTPAAGALMQGQSVTATTTRGSATANTLETSAFSQDSGVTAADDTATATSPASTATSPASTATSPASTATSPASTATSPASTATGTAPAATATATTPASTATTPASTATTPASTATGTALPGGGTPPSATPELGSGELFATGLVPLALALLYRRRRARHAGEHTDTEDVEA